MIEELTYNLYRLSFSQPGNPDHEALALVRVSSTSQHYGVLHHVTGLLGMGMEYKHSLSKDFRSEKGYYRQVKLGTILNGAGKQSLESVCRSTEPPYVPELLFESRKKIEENQGGRKVRDCAVWIDEVVETLLEMSVLIPSAEEDAESAMIVLEKEGS